MYIFIKGEDIPLEAPDSMFDQLATAMSDFTNKKGDTVLKLNSMTVRASEIKRLKKSESPSVTMADNQELNRLARQFETEVLAPYLTPKGLTMEKELELFRDKGCITLTKLKPDGEGKSATDFLIAVCNSLEYSALQNKLNAWQEYKGRFQYAEKKRLEDLEKSKGLVAQNYDISQKEEGDNV